MQLRNVVVVLVRPEGPQNVGGVARLCGNFGTTLRLVAPQCDVTSRDAVKMAHPYEEGLCTASHFDTLDAALADVTFSLATSVRLGEALKSPALDVERARLLLPGGGEQTAVVFGNERTGLHKDEAARCTRLIRLPTPGPIESFNLASAVAVTLTLFHVASLASADPRATRTSRTTLRRDFEAALTSVDFYRRTTKEQFAPRLQELLDKMDLSDRDAELLSEMLVLLRR